MGKFVIKPVKSGYTFHLKARNGEVIATSEVYSSLSTCKHGTESVRKNAAAAHLEDQTAKEPAPAKNPKFELYLDKGGKYLKATNGEIIAVSAAYKEKGSCLKGIESVRHNAPEAEVIVEEA